MERICFGVNPRKTLIRVIAWSACTFLFFRNLLVPMQIIGSSMSPTYESGDVNFIYKLAYAFNKPRRGDVVAVRGDKDLLLKRIVGLPGERISLEEGVLRVNGKPLSDRFAGVKIPSAPFTLLLRPDQYFMIGDCRQNTVFWAAAKNDILGKIVF